MSQELPTPGGPESSTRKPLLILFITCMGIVLFSLLSGMHQIVETEFGQGLAMVSVAVATVVILIMILMGVGLGGAIEVAIRKRFLFFKRQPRPGSRLDWFLKLWGSRIDMESTQPTEPMSEGIPPGVSLTDMEELLTLTEQGRRGGKKSLHSDDVQFRAVRDWMILQSRGASITLQQFLEERFGVSAESGMPLVPNQTFYSWRKKFLKELEQHKGKKRD